MLYDYESCEQINIFFFLNFELLSFSHLKYIGIHTENSITLNNRAACGVRPWHSLLMVLCSGRDVIVLPIVIKSADGCLAKILSPN